FQDGNADSPTTQIHIHSSKERPKHAYVAVPYRDYWYWIEDSNLPAKRALGAVMFFFTLSETDSSEKTPLVTIPAQ
ncbi:MAG: hypothetical protein ACRESJ_26425, partial [Pseudomonas sp.]